MNTWKLVLGVALVFIVGALVGSAGHALLSQTSLSSLSCWNPGREQPSS